MKLFIFIFSWFFVVNLVAQTDNRAPNAFTKAEVYRQNPNLSIYMYYPDNMKVGEVRPALVLFFGGGWISGAPKAFENQAIHFQDRGLIVILADYRTNSVFATPPEESVKDAKSVMRYVRANAKWLHIDSTMIAAGGSSAGGHLAAACATIDTYNNDNDNFAISPNPDALVLFNPVINNGPGNYGYDRVGAYYEQFSPYHNLRKSVPPTIIMQGTSDNLVSMNTMELYKHRMDSLGIRCDLHWYEGQEHGFFNFENREYYDKTVEATDEFLVSLNYLNIKTAYDSLVDGDYMIQSLDNTSLYMTGGLASIIGNPITFETLVSPQNDTQIWTLTKGLSGNSVRKYSIKSKNQEVLIGLTATLKLGSGGNIPVFDQKYHSDKLYVIGDSVAIKAAAGVADATTTYSAKFWRKSGSKLILSSSAAIAPSIEDFQFKLIRVDNTTEIEHTEKRKFKFNATKGGVRIFGDDQTNYSILSINGRIIKEGASSASVFVSLSNGLYVIRLKSALTSFSEKLIVN